MLSKQSSQVYISGALTMFDRKDWYEAVGKVVDSLGYYAYVPHLHIDSEKTVTSKEIYETDMRELEKSFLVIADVSCPSLGVGAELERSNAKQIPVVLMYEKDHIASDFVQGMPAVIKEIAYPEKEYALRELNKFLREYSPE